MPQNSQESKPKNYVTVGLLNDSLVLLRNGDPRQTQINSLKLSPGSSTRMGSRELRRKAERESKKLAKGGVK